MHHVIIIGCGFAGLEAAKTLANKPVKVTVLDRTNHHLFQPLLYQVATAGLSAPAIAAPIRRILRKQKNLTVLMKEVTHLDPMGKQVHCEDGEIFAYDSLIVATGATHSYFGHDEWAEHAPGLKTLEDAMNIRRRILTAFERAEDEPAQAAQWLSFAVIGAGPTGVEMAGTMAEIARHTLRGEFRNIDPTTAQILLIEGGPRVLASYAPDLSDKALRQLSKLGVQVRLNAKVSEIDADGVWIGQEHLAARTVIWAAGVQASPLAKSLGVPLDRAGKVPVQSDLSVPGLQDVYVVGDLAVALSHGKPAPGVSPAAKQMGRTVARNILAKIAGRPPQPFVYVDYGSLATIGRSSAIAHVGPFKFSGFPAWLFWLFVHVFFLIGFRNRLMVIADWAWSYLTFARSARIMQSPRRPDE